MRQGTQAGTLTTSRDRVGREVGAGFRMGGTHGYLWQIHVGAWQKPSQYCKVMTSQLKLINLKNPTCGRSISSPPKSPILPFLMACSMISALLSQPTQSHKTIPCNKSFNISSNSSISLAETSMIQ